MAQGSDILSDIRAGISQSERRLAALVPEYVRIDDRDIADLLKFITELSAQVNYFNFSNVPEGNWQDFFKSEAYILVALVSKYDLSTNLNKYDKFVSLVNTAENDEELLKRLSDIFAFLFSEVVGNISLLQRDFEKTEHNSGTEEFSELMNSFDAEIARLYQYRRDVDAFGAQAEPYFRDLPAALQPAERTGTIFKGTGVKKKIFNALPHITKLFNDFHAKYNHLLSVSNNYLKKYSLLERDYDPHISLLMTFLVLYQHLRNKINGITRRHLDFYYNEVLGISRVGATPDQVNVLFELDEGLSSMTIPAAEMLEAIIPGKEKPELYRLEKDMRLTNASIAELKTLFISDYFHYDSRSISEAQVFARDNPLFKPSVYVKKLAEPVTWPLLGEDQHDLATNLRTMNDTDIGLVVGSPLFYQSEGDRLVSIKVHFSPSSFLDFKSYVGNFAEVTGKQSRPELELLGSAFVIDYTSPEGWESVDAYNVSCPLGEERDNTIQVSFRLGPAGKPVDIYNQAIHKQSYQSAFPLVRLLLNNYTSHNPYTFFRQMLVERVSIDIDVNGYTNLKLQNNIGGLSRAHPFQVFGPQPTVGSFLNIKNTNVFNRYTKSFCLHIEWLDLPKDKGGFETYYEGYGAPVTNNSFEIGLSAVQDGSFKPVPAEQQAYHLFETDMARAQLKGKTDIDGVDFKKIEFTNSPGMSLENDVSDAAYKKGVVRIELLSPSFAFGHRLYPQIFPEVVMNNAKRFTKKKPLPNQPYIPMVKAISVDFKLSHSENFRDKADEPEEDLQLIHQYPFGYETIYPGNDKKNYYFMPQFDQSANLFIGLKNVQAGQELSMLFNLEEKNFHHTLHEPDLVSWSYLDGNTWSKLDTKEILYDTTNNFINSGIVVIKMPQEITTGSTILNPGLFWLRASILKTEHVPRVTAIYTNAATASRLVNDQAEPESDFNLGANIIKGFTRNLKGLQNVWQLFPSFAGRPAETTDKYYVRVSERLRHNQRPVQMEDIIQVVLEEFPQILMVKCFGTDTEAHLVLPGVDLQVVLIPKEREDGRFISQQPKVNLAALYSVKTFLEKLISPFVNVEVGNPVYEKIKVICKVSFRDNETANYGFYTKKLNEEINNFIAPWLYGASEDLKIGAKIYKSDLLLFIKQRPYVQYVTEFSVIHFFNVDDIVTNDLKADIQDTAIESLDYVCGSGPAAVLLPSEHHKITVISEPAYEDPKMSGIGTFTIGEELLVGEQGPHEKPGQKDEQALSGLDEVFNLTIMHNLE